MCEGEREGWGLCLRERERERETESEMACRAEKNNILAIKNE